MAQNIEGKVPPVCPNCRLPLLSLDVEETTSMGFDPETGRYNIISEALDTLCNFCGHQCNDLFSDGPINYHTEWRKEVSVVDKNGEPVYLRNKE